MRSSQRKGNNGKQERRNRCEREWRILSFFFGGLAFLNRQSFPHPISRDAIRWKGSRLSRHGFTVANDPVDPTKGETLLSYSPLHDDDSLRRTSDRERIHLLMLFTGHETATRHTTSPPSEKRMTDDNDDDVSSHFSLFFWCFFGVFFWVSLISILIKYKATTTRG